MDLQLHNWFSHTHPRIDDNLDISELPWSSRILKGGKGKCPQIFSFFSISESSETTIYEERI